MDFLELAKNRYSCRSFSDKKVEREKRKDANDRLISRKGLIGKGVGFAPLICLFVGYLIIPLVIIGLTSMSGAFSQLGGV